MKIKIYKFSQENILPDVVSVNNETEKSITEKVNEFNNKWFNSKRQNIGLNSFYNQTVDEENKRNSWDEKRIPYVKAPSGNIKQTGEFVSAPGDDRLITQNIWYSSIPLSDAKEKLSIDDGTIVADPKFKDISSYNFELNPDSPAFELGFKPIDTKNIGVIR